MTQTHARTATFFVIVLSALSMSGCLASKLKTVHGQACSFEQNFALTVSDGISLTLLDPVLDREDVTVIAGIAPKMKGRKGKTHYASYTVRKTGDGEPYEIPVNIEFQKRDGALLLARLSAESPLFALMPSEQLPDMIDCTMRFPVWRTRFEMPVPEFDQAVLPSREQLVDLVDPPVAESHGGTVLVYRFVIEGEGDTGRPGTITLIYNANGQRILRTHIQYYHYDFGTDFEQGKAWMKIKLSRLNVVSK